MFIKVLTVFEHIFSSFDAFDNPVLHNDGDDDDGNVSVTCF